MPTAEFIARSDPARILATCKAHRAIVEQCRPAHDDAIAGGYDMDAWAEVTLRALASIWADHGAFRAEWAL